MFQPFIAASTSATAALPLSPAPRASTLRSIERQWSKIQYRAAKALGADGNALDSVTRPGSILGGSHKTEVAEGASGALVAVSYLAPGAMLARFAGIDAPAAPTLCAMATLNDCEGGCLGGDNGRGQLSFAMGTARMSQLGRTVLLLGAPELFAALLSADCKRHALKARKQGKRAFIRLDGTSDIGMASGALETLKGYGVSPYDYTKLPGRASNNAGRYPVTFSATPRTLRAAKSVLDAGGSIAVVVGAKRGASAHARTLAVLSDLAEATGSTFIEGDKSEPLELEPRTIRCLTAKAGSNKAFSELVGSGLVFA